MSTTKPIIKTTLFQHQLEFLEWAQDKVYMLLGDDMGLGKSLQALALAIERKYKYGYTHCLIVVGVNNLKYNWQKEILKHTDEKCIVLGDRLITKGKNKGRVKSGSTTDKFEDLKTIPEEYFWIINIEALRDPRISSLIREFCVYDKIQICIADEIHKIGKDNTQMGKGFQRIICTDRLALSGTPLINKPLDLYMVLKWLKQETHSYWQFENHYTIKDRFNPAPVGYKNLHEIKYKLEHIMLRRMKKDVLNLPEKIESYDYLDLPPLQKQIYNEIVHELQEEIDKIILHPNPLTKFTRCRQATVCPEILSSTISESIKFERTIELIQDNISNGGKSLVFCSFKEAIINFLPLLKSFNPAVIHGDIGVNQRTLEEQKFQEDPNCHVLIGTIRAMGTGLNLTAANLVIFLDSDWSPAIKNQAIDRAHRIGTKGTVNVVTLVCKGTIDEKIEELHSTKQEFSDILVDNKYPNTAKLKLLKWLIEL